MTVFANAAHLQAGRRWVADQRRDSQRNRCLRRVLCQLAWAASHKKDSHLAALYRRVRSRRREQKAIMAAAHQLITMIFHIVRNGSVYQELDANHHDQQNKPKITRKLVDRLQKLGSYVMLQPIEAPGPSEPVPPIVTESELAEPAQKGPAMQVRRGCYAVNFLNLCR